jgi:hypothetical protein
MMELKGTGIVMCKFFDVFLFMICLLMDWIWCDLWNGIKKGRLCLYLWENVCGDLACTSIYFYFDWFVWMIEC